MQAHRPTAEQTRTLVRAEQKLVGRCLEDFGIVWKPAPALPPAMPLRFCGNTGSGSGQVAGNNAASAYNWYDGYVGTVYYSAGYKGISDTVGARSGMSTLWNTRNDNRSIRFSSTW
ncbi:hypothetical protein [Streptomyces vietnamensis]|uniref:hypothetical protein n=2 Tax=Streptomyces vietnamensis TaxID=362257 RepID=UPI003413C908